MNAQGAGETGPGANATVKKETVVDGPGSYEARRPSTDDDEVEQTTPKKRKARNETRDPAAIRRLHPDSVLVEPRCERCEGDNLDCLRRPGHHGKCLTCTSGYCSFFGGGTRRSSHHLGKSTPESPTLVNPADVAELIRVIPLARKVTHTEGRQYLIARARLLARAMGFGLADCGAADLEEAPAGGSGSTNLGGHGNSSGGSLSP